MKILFKRYNSSLNFNTIYSHGIKIYEDPLNQRDLIREENNGKIGIYC
jgi:hypothetical protein